MAKSYTELEAWGIFIGALVIGIVLTSIFWAIITVPEQKKKIDEQIEQAAHSNRSVPISEPTEFLTFCQRVDGAYRWDHTGLRECTVPEISERNIMVMDLLCKTFNLSLSYGSYGIKCEGTIRS
jgi:hypothetical protein